MDSYQFILKDYHAIEYASLDLNGITIIAGINGSGKSTLSKWLYAIVYYSNQFEKLVDDNAVNRLNDEIKNMNRINRHIGFSLKARRIRIIPYIKIEDGFDSDKLFYIFQDRLGMFINLLSSTEGKDKNWIKEIIEREMNVTTSNFDETIQRFYEYYLEKADRILEELKQTKLNHKTKSLFEFLEDERDLFWNIPQCFIFRENGKDIIDNNNFKEPLGLTDAIYIDTPMALTDINNNNNGLWRNLTEALITPKKQPLSDAEKKIAKRIRLIIGGKVDLKEDENTHEKNLIYIREKDNLNIPINETATGLKSFAIILRLIENGYLNNRSLLIIDEPEAHLHPQWIVEFAKIMVLLNKEIGSKIMLASHNPDMIAALKSISEAYELNDNIKYYQAKTESNGLKYTYEDLDRNIEPIFESFNIALDRIEEYGKR